MNKNNSIRIDVDLLHPWLKHKLNKLLVECNKQGIYLIITEGFRTKEYQDELYAKGRTKAGNIVTNARGSDYASQHQWGVAFDIAINDNKLLYDVNTIRKVANITKQKSINLGWGGDWTGFKDYPHFYLKKWGSTPTPLKIVYRTVDNFKKTWVANVHRKDGLYIWDKTHKKQKRLMPNGAKVNVLWKHIRWSRIEYDGTVGYARSKFLK